MGYITNFIVYTLAMVGVIVVALLVFKNATSIGGGKASKYLKIIDSISLGQRKNLYIVSTGKEQFLIAGDVNNTCLISKLEGICGVAVLPNTQIPECEPINEFKTNIGSSKSFKDTLNSLPKTEFMDKSNIGIKSSMLREKTSGSVMKNIADIMRK